MEGIEFTDRYGGGPGPDPETVCKGDCEGTGWVPIMESETDPEYRRRWQEAHEEERARGVVCDGTHFVKCVTCNGSGKRESVHARD